MIWLNALRRWLGMAENPPATSGDVSVLFVLQSKAPRPMTLIELNAATKIPYPELRREMERLEWLGRVRMEREEAGQGDANRRYWIVKRKGSDNAS